MCWFGCLGVKVQWCKTLKNQSFEEGTLNLAMDLKSQRDAFKIISGSRNFKLQTASKFRTAWRCCFNNFVDYTLHIK